MENLIFLAVTDWVVQDPYELIRYCSPIYVLCVSSHPKGAFFTQKFMNFQRFSEKSRHPQILEIFVAGFSEKVIKMYQLILFWNGNI